MFAVRNRLKREEARPLEARVLLAAKPVEGTVPSWVASYGWSAVFEDHFSGTALDTNAWRIGYPWGSTHNHQGIASQYRVPVEGGVLSLVAGGPDSKVGDKYRTGIISLQQKIDVSDLNQDYTVVARLKLSPRDGTWPAFWLNSDGKWPNINEIDMMEQQGFSGSPSANPAYKYESNFHFATSQGTRSSQHKTKWSDNLETNYHEYRVVFTKNKVELRLDGDVVNEVTGARARKLRQDGTIGNYSLILNNAIGGDWGGDGYKNWIDDETNSAAFMVDYVGVYRRPAQ